MTRLQTAMAIAFVCLAATTACNKKKKALQSGPPPAYAGSYIESCRAITSLASGFISAECADTHGQFVLSYIQAAACAGDIGNNDGLLACNGATATKTKPDLNALALAAPSDEASDPATSGAAPAAKTADGLK